MMEQSQEAMWKNLAQIKTMMVSGLVNRENEFRLLEEMTPSTPVAFSKCHLVGFRVKHSCATVKRYLFWKVSRTATSTDSALCCCTRSLALSLKTAGRFIDMGTHLVGTRPW